jgi:hypothetical protein
MQACLFWNGIPELEFFDPRDTEVYLSSPPAAVPCRAHVRRRRAPLACMSAGL